MPQRDRVAETGPVRDQVDGRVGLLQQLLGEQDALAGQPAQRRGPGLLDEPAGEGPLGQVRPLGQLPDGDRLGQVALHPADDLAQRVTGQHGHRLVHVLGLAAVPVRRDDHPPGDPVGHPGALLLAHQVQAGVDARRGARAGDDQVLVHVEHVGVDHGLRVPLGQFGGLPPVRRAPPPVQQARRAEGERAGAHAQHPGAAGHRGLQGLDHRRRELAGRPGGTAGVVAPRTPRPGRRRPAGPGRSLADTVKPADDAERTGLPATTAKSYRGSPSSVRSTPKTSQTTPSSNGVNSFRMTTATLRSMVLSCGGRILPSTVTTATGSARTARASWIMTYTDQQLTTRPSEGRARASPADRGRPPGGTGGGGHRRRVQPRTAPDAPSSSSARTGS